MKDSAVLLIDCPDRKGLVARVAGLLYEHGANILHADQHQDHELGLFFMRVEWGLNGGHEQPRLPPRSIRASVRSTGRGTRHASEIERDLPASAHRALLFAVSALHGRPAIT